MEAGNKFVARNVVTDMQGTAARERPSVAPTSSVRPGPYKVRDFQWTGLWLDDLPATTHGVGWLGQMLFPNDPPNDGFHTWSVTLSYQLTSLCHWTKSKLNSS